MEESRREEMNERVQENFGEMRKIFYMLTVMWLHGC